LSHELDHSVDPKYATTDRQTQENYAVDQETKTATTLNEPTRNTYDNVGADVYVNDPTIHTQVNPDGSTSWAAYANGQTMVLGPYQPGTSPSVAPLFVYSADGNIGPLFSSPNYSDITLSGSSFTDPATTTATLTPSSFPGIDGYNYEQTSALSPLQWNSVDQLAQAQDTQSQQGIEGNFFRLSTPDTLGSNPFTAQPNVSGSLESGNPNILPVSYSSETSAGGINPIDAGFNASAIPWTQTSTGDYSYVGVNPNDMGGYGANANPFNAYANLAGASGGNPGGASYTDLGGQNANPFDGSTNQNLSSATGGEQLGNYGMPPSAETPYVSAES
jgi:hypothetical protein